MDYDNRVSWNVNGLIGANRISQLITRLEVEGFPDFVCLQETHSDNREIISGWCSRLRGYKCYFGHGDGRNKGTAIFLNRLVRLSIPSSVVYISTFDLTAGTHVLVLNSWEITGRYCGDGTLLLCSNN